MKTRALTLPQIRSRAKAASRRPSKKSPPVPAHTIANKVVSFLKTHPTARQLWITVARDKVTVKAQKLSLARKKAAVAPAGFFTRYYTPALATEDNALAVHSALDPADFRE